MIYFIFSLEYNIYFTHAVIIYWPLRHEISPDVPKLRRDILQWIRLSASVRPPVLCLGIEHQNVLGNIKIYLEGSN